MSRRRISRQPSLSQALTEAKVDLQYHFWRELREKLNTCEKLRPWPAMGAEVSRESIKGYYEKSKNKPEVHLTYNTGMLWRNKWPVLLRLELLTDLSRPNLTIKLLCSKPEDPTQWVTRDQVEDTEILCNVLDKAGFGPGFNRSPWSLVTGDLVMNPSEGGNGEKLDLTMFTGRARALVDPQKRPILINDVVKSIQTFMEKARAPLRDAGVTESTI